MAKDSNTVMQKISKAEEAIKSTYERLKVLEDKLTQEKLPESKTQLINRELEEVRKLLATHEEQLAHLRTHNRNNFVFVVALLFIFFTLYMLYILVNGGEV